MKLHNLVLILVLFLNSTTGYSQELVEEPKQTQELLIWIDDSLPENATTAGDWIWDPNMVFSGTASHTNVPTEGLSKHSFESEPILLGIGSVIEQYVLLDPEKPPKGIMLELYLEDGKIVTIFWEGEEEVFALPEEEEIYYRGTLPEKGRWVRLLIPAQELGIEEKKLRGMAFAVFDGRAWWDRTAIVKELTQGE